MSVNGIREPIAALSTHTKSPASNVGSMDPDVMVKACRATTRMVKRQKTKHPLLRSERLQDGLRSLSIGLFCAMAEGSYWTPHCPGKPIPTPALCDSPSRTSNGLAANRQRLRLPLAPDAC